ncbi:MAG: alpha-galactosidase, partial [Paracoccaceae bacterium]
MQFWRLDCGTQTLLLGGGNGLAEVFYWGTRLPDAENPLTIWAATRLDYSGGVLDGVPSLSICPEISKTFAGHPGMRIRATTGERIEPRFVFMNAEQSPDALILDYKDKAHGLSYQARFLVHTESDVIEIAASLSSKNAILVDWFA